MVMVLLLPVPNSLSYVIFERLMVMVPLSLVFTLMTFSVAAPARVKSNVFSFSVVKLKVYVSLHLILLKIQLSHRKTGRVSILPSLHLPFQFVIQLAEPLVPLS